MFELFVSNHNCFLYVLIIFLLFFITEQNPHTNPATLPTSHPFMVQANSSHVLLLIFCIFGCLRAFVLLPMEILIDSMCTSAHVLGNVETKHINRVFIPKPN